MRTPARMPRPGSKSASDKGSPPAKVPRFDLVADFAEPLADREGKVREITEWARRRRARVQIIEGSRHFLKIAWSAFLGPIDEEDERDFRERFKPFQDGRIQILE